MPPRVKITTFSRIFGVQQLWTCGRGKSEISTATSIFWGPAIQQKDLEYCTTEPKVENPRWRPPKPELLISRLVGNTETKSQRLNLHYRGPAIQ